MKPDLFLALMLFVTGVGCMALQLDGLWDIFDFGALAAICACLCTLAEGDLT